MHMTVELLSIVIQYIPFPLIPINSNSTCVRSIQIPTHELVSSLYPKPRSNVLENDLLLVSLKDVKRWMEA